jgi:hypothetical protein
LSNSSNATTFANTAASAAPQAAGAQRIVEEPRDDTRATNMPVHRTTLTTPQATHYIQNATSTQHSMVSIEYLPQSGAIVRGDSTTNPHYSHLKPQLGPVILPHLQSCHTTQHTSTSDSS